MRRNWKRILAAILAACMIFSNSSLVYAMESSQGQEEFGLETEETEVSEKDLTEPVEDEMGNSDEEEKIETQPSENMVEQSEGEEIQVETGVTQEVFETVDADKETENVSEPISFSTVYINPLYADVITEDDLVQPSEAVTLADDVEYTSDIDEAAERLRESLVAREETIRLGYSYEGTGTNEEIQGKINAIANIAFEHTGNPKEGDYLSWQYGGYVGNAQGKGLNGKLELVFTYTVTYYTTAEQEATVNQEVERLLSKLALNQVNDYQKIKKIYDFLCLNVKYDYDNLNNVDNKLKHTAYAALINKTAVCQGYAVLFYRLALEAGVDARVITGNAGGPHAWNITKLGGYYYNLDSTWDAGRESYSWFLKSEADFPNHIRSAEEGYTSEEFNNAYPMSKMSYDPELYLGHDYYWDSGEYVLNLHYGDFEQNELEFNKDTIVHILNTRQESGECFDRIEIFYPENTKSVSKEVWNAAVSLLKNSENREIMFQIGGDDTYEMNWFARKPIEAQSDVTFSGSIIPGGAGEYAAVSFVNTEFPAEEMNVSFSTNDKSNNYQQLISAFGESNMELTLLNNFGVQIENSGGRFDLDVWDDCSYANVSIWGVDKLTANVSYSLEKRVYKGEINSWTGDNGEKTYELNIKAWGAGKEFLTDEEVIEILNLNNDNKFDRINIEQGGDSRTIDAEVYNTARNLLDENSGRPMLAFGFQNETQILDWHIYNPGEIYSDLDASVEYQVSAGNAPTITFKSNELKGELVELVIGHRHSSSEAELTKEYLGNSDKNIEIQDTEVKGWYFINDYGVLMNLNITDTLIPGNTYIIQESVYHGSVEEWDGEYILDIDPWSAGKDGSEFTLNEIKEILDYHAQQGNKFSTINISYPEREVTVEIWNAAVSLLNEWSNREIEISFNDGRDNQRYQTVWRFAGVEETTESLNISTRLVFSVENVRIYTNRQKFPAENASVSIRLNSLDYGPHFPELQVGGKTVFDSSGHIVPNMEANIDGYSEEGYRSWEISIHGLQNFSGTNLNLKEYSGKVNEWYDDEGKPHRTLNISYRDLDMDHPIDDSTLTKILGLSHTSGYYDEIELVQYGDKTAISPKIWNKMYSLLTKEGCIRVRLVDEKETKEWEFFGVKQQSNDLKFDFTLVPVKLNSEEKLEMMFGNTAFPAEQVMFSYYVDTYGIKSDKKWFNELRTYFGDSSRCFDLYTIDPSNNEEIIIEDSEIEVYTDVYEYEGDVSGYITIRKNDISTLEPNTSYWMKPAEYKPIVDTWEDGRTNAIFHYDRFEEYGLDYTEENFLTVLDSLYLKGKIFNSIEVILPNDTTKISAELWNKLMEHLEKDDSAQLNILIESESDFAFEWYFNKPKTVETKAPIYLSAKVSTYEKGIKVVFDETKYTAENVNVSFWINDGKENYFPLFPNYNGHSLSFTDHDGKILSDMHVSKNISDGENRTVNVYIDGILKLDRNTEYHIIPYVGDVNEATDDQGNVTAHVLNIDVAFDGDGWKNYTEKELAEILAYHEEHHLTYDEIYIHQTESERNIIYAEVAKSATSLLKPSDTSLMKQGALAFCFWGESGNVGWKFIDPKAQPLKQNIDVNFLLEADSMNKQLKLTAFAYEEENGQRFSHISDAVAADNIRLEIYTYDNEYVREFIEQSHGALEFKEDPNVLVDGWIDRDMGCIGVDNLQQMELNKCYSIQKGTYRGYVDENPDGTISLGLAASGLNKSKFSDADVEAIVQYYKAKDMMFDMIYVDQVSSTSNVIDKDVINSLSSLLNEETEDNRILMFTFTKGTAAVEDINWLLTNPGHAEKDINANVVLSSTANKGISIKVNKNTYNAEGVLLSIVSSPTTATGQKITAGLGKVSEIDQPIELSVLKGGTTVVNDVSASYVEYAPDSEAGIMYEIALDNVDKLEGGVNYQLNQYAKDAGIFKVGVDVKILEQEWLSEQAKAGTKHSFKCMTTDTASIDGTGTIIPLNDGELRFTVTYNYDGKSWMEVYRGEIITELQSISLNRTDLKFQLLPGNIEKFKLEVKPYPLNYNLDESKISCVTLSGNSDVLEVDNQGNLIIKSTGEETVIVTYIFAEEENREPLTARCTVEVEELINVNSLELPKVYAVTNFDTKLKDVELPSGTKDGVSWKYDWKEPETGLSNYKDMESHGFTAIYTETDVHGKTRSAEVILSVDMVKITGIDIIAVDDKAALIEIPKYLSVGNSITWNVNILLSGNITEEEAHDILLKYFESGRLKVEWSCTKGCDVTQESLEDNYGVDICKFTAEEGKIGKKTFTATMKDTANKNKVLFKDSESITVVTNDNEVAELEWMKEHMDIVPDINGAGIGKIIFRQPADRYYKLTFSTSDKSIVKIDTKNITIDDKKYGVDDTDVVEIVLPYEEVKPGFAQITVTAADKLKSSMKIDMTVADYSPKVLETSFAINKAYDADTAPVTIQFPENYMALKDEEFSVEIVGEKYADLFAYDFNDDSKETAEAGIRKVSGELKIVEAMRDKVANGTHKVPIKISYSYMRDRVQNGETIWEKVSGTFDTTISVKVTQKVPSISFKQTKKVNLFYTEGEERDGLLTVNTGNLRLLSLEADPESGFTLSQNSDGSYSIKAGTAVAKSQKVELTYTLEDKDCGTISNLKKTLTISVEEKAPTLLLSAKSETLYPYYGPQTATVHLTDKTTGEPVEICQVKWVQDKKKDLIRDIGNTSTELPKASKNQFNAFYDGSSISFELKSDAIKSGTDTYKLQVWEEGWSKPVEISYSLKVDVSKPKLKLGTSKVTLNKNAEVLEYQMASTSLTLNGYSKNFDGEVRFTGYDDKSSAVLNKAITLDYREEEGIVVKLHPSNVELKNTTYKYKVWVSNEYFETSATFSVTIVDKTVASSVKVSKSGSIDVLRRETTAITYTPKMSNFSGIVVAAYLEGPDANKFYQAEPDGNKLVLKACSGEGFSTKATYRIIPVFVIENADGERYEVKAATQLVKVTQGKPKVTFMADKGKTLYQQFGNELKLRMEAMLKDENITIEKVTLLNYTNDLDVQYQEQDGTVTLKMIENRDMSKSQITKSGSSVTLKFGIVYSDRAGNESVAQVSYKVTIK